MEEYVYLEHHGVKGMKWGIRKKRFSSSSGNTSLKKKKNTGVIASIKRRKALKEKSKRAKIREDNRVKKNEERDKKSIKSMTDSELDTYIRRLQKEKQAKDLKYDQLSSARKIINKAARDSTTRILTTTSYQIGMHLIGSRVNKAFGEEVINASNKKKKKDKDND